MPDIRPVSDMTHLLKQYWTKQKNQQEEQM